MSYFINCVIFPRLLKNVVMYFFRGTRGAAAAAQQQTLTILHPSFKRF